VSISYRTDKAIDLAAWLALYHACSWNRDWTLANAEVMAAHAYLIETAWEDDAILGSATVLSDGLSYATIDDVVVLPTRRGQGIGSELMKVAVEALAHLPPGVIKLRAIPGAEDFYRRLGFRESGETVMSWQR
jgi:GNAT superfamily N-acetyltransferase